MIKVVLCSESHLKNAANPSDGDNLTDKCMIITRVLFITLGEWFIHQRKKEKKPLTDIPNIESSFALQKNISE